MKLFIATAIAALATGASAQSNCGPRESVVALLADSHRESPRAAGTVNGNIMMEVWASEGGSWTIFITGPDGISCMVAAGHDFSTAIVPPSGEPM